MLREVGIGHVPILTMVAAPISPRLLPCPSRLASVLMSQGPDENAQEVEISGEDPKVLELEDAVQTLRKHVEHLLLAEHQGVERQAFKLLCGVGIQNLLLLRRGVIVLMMMLLLLLLLLIDIEKHQLLLGQANAPEEIALSHLQAVHKTLGIHVFMEKAMLESIQRVHLKPLMDVGEDIWKPSDPHLNEPKDPRDERETEECLIAV